MTCTCCGFHVFELFRQNQDDTSPSNLQVSQYCSIRIYDKARVRQLSVISNGGDPVAVGVPSLSPITI